MYVAMCILAPIYRIVSEIISITFERLRCPNQMPMLKISWWFMTTDNVELIPDSGHAPWWG